MNDQAQRAQRTTIARFLLGACIAAGVACSSGGGGDSQPADTGPTRAFMMGATPFFATPTTFPDWRFDHLADKDLLSVHADDFWGVPWIQFRDNAALPQPWVDKWTAFANSARATGKARYLALSPLTDRITLASDVQADGSTRTRWAPTDANGCYLFATDAAAAGYKDAYIKYVTYLIGLVQPSYVSPAIEVNIQFTACPAQKAAWIAWYADVHNAIKAAFPDLVVFPTFQLEHLYGLDPPAICAAGVSRNDCFDARLAEALTMPGDRIAFSSYPIGWKYHADFNFSFPRDTYARVQAATTRKIWIAETGYAAVRIFASYPHAGVGSCGTELFPPTYANDTEQAAYLSWLLAEAQTRNMESVIWWLERDYLDGTVAARCPCDPATSDTCIMTDTFFNVGGANGELLMRFFGNMALRNYDNSPRPAHTIWRSYLERRLRPAS